MKAQILSRVCSLSQSPREFLIEKEKCLNAKAVQRTDPELRPWNQENLASYPSSVTLTESGGPQASHLISMGLFVSYLKIGIMLVPTP